MNIPYISAEEVRKNLSMEDAIQCTENVYKLKSQDKTIVWPTIFYEFDPGHADMDIKSGYLPEQHICGHKTVAFMEANVQKGLPDLVGLIAVFSSETGMPLGLVDGSSVTGMRTGAAGAIGSALPVFTDIGLADFFSFTWPDVQKTDPALQYSSTGSSSRSCALPRPRSAHGSDHRKSYPRYSFRLSRTRDHSP